MVVGWLGFCGV